MRENTSILSSPSPLLATNNKTNRRNNSTERIRSFFSTLFLYSVNVRQKWIPIKRSPFYNSRRRSVTIARPLYFRVCGIAELSVARLTPAISNERRIVACLYSVVFTAEPLVNTRRKQLVKQPVVVRDSDHRIPPSSGGRNLVDDTRACESRFPSRFPRTERRKEGRKEGRGSLEGADDPLPDRGCVLSQRPHRCRDLHVIQFCDSYIRDI